jgi:hypothetical protein
MIKLINSDIFIFFLFFLSFRVYQWVLKNKVRFYTFCLASIIFYNGGLFLMRNFQISDNYFALIGSMINFCLLTNLFCLLKQITRIEMYGKYPIIGYNLRSDAYWHNKYNYTMTNYEYVYSALLLIGAFGFYFLLLSIHGFI